jgi:C-terminal processing protease CtpA/Prc
LRAQANGEFVVLGVAQAYGKEIQEAIHAGDKLIKVDKLEVKARPLATVIDALRGKVNEKRTLVLERDSKPFTVIAPVLRIL